MLTIVYPVYLAISIALTVRVAKTLERNGRVFLLDAFDGNEPLADSVNRLLVVGFYLMNVGYVVWATKTSARPEEAAPAIELLTEKIGPVLLVLGAMHFANMYIFNRMRRRALVRHQPPPVLPSEFVAPPRAERVA